jgi:sucrose-6-phosphate hydrolase SacC (GH32 family)
MENNQLRMKPLENLTKLREELLLEETNQALLEINEKLETVNHKMLEVIVEFEETEKEVGVEIKKDPAGQEKTVLLYDKGNREFWLDRRKSRLDRLGDKQGGLLEIDKGLKVQLFIDHSTIECFLNNKRMITSRAYPTLKNSDHLSLIGDGHTKIKSIKVYRLRSIWKMRRNE